MKVKEVAERLEVSATTIYALVSDGKLRHYRVGQGRGCIRIAEEHLAEFLAGVERKAEPSPPAATGRRVKLKHLRLS